MKILHKYQGWGVRILLVTMAMLWLTLMAATWADAEAAEPSAAPQEDDEYNFKWLDPEKKIYVLQNRRYTKGNRLLLSVTAGPGFSNPYRNSYNVDPRIAYYLSETWGFEAFYTFTINSENGVFEALQQATTALPVVREVRSQAGLLVHWVPWYAKINVFNNILYFDWYFTAGAGTMRTALDARSGVTGLSRAPGGNYVMEDYFAPMIGTGHQYHLSNSLTVRLDFTGSFYRASVFPQGVEKAWFPNYNFGIGLGYRL